MSIADDRQMIAFRMVKHERIRQDAKWGEQDHDPFCWITILGEEFGEASRAAMERHFGNGTDAELMTELAHVAAVAVAAIECLLRGTWSWGQQTHGKGPEVLNEEA